MTPGSFAFETLLDAAASEVFDWHARPGAFERLVPPWQRVRVLKRSGGICDGDRVDLLVGSGLLRTRWQLEHREYEAGRQFCDVQVRGPFASFRHEHLFEQVEGGTRMTDHVAFDAPLGPLGDVAESAALRRRLRRLIEVRNAMLVAEAQRYTP